MTTPYFAAVLADNPEALWRLDETSGSTVADATGNGHSGAVVGAQLDQAGPDVGIPSAVGFDGVDDYLDFGTPDELIDVGADFTVEVWARPETSNPDHRMVIGSGDDGYFLRTMFNDTWQFITYRDGDHYALNAGGGNYVANEWRHLVGVLRGGETMEIWVNGTLINSRTDFINDVNPLNTGFLIGADSFFGPRRFFNGRAAAAAVYSYALSPQQIENHYALASEEPTAPEGSGSIAAEGELSGVGAAPLQLRTVRPVQTLEAGGWIAQPSGTLHGVLSDEDDATYAEGVGV